MGYYAGPGYDLTTGLGSPNGTLLARTMTAIGHAQYFFDEDPWSSSGQRCRRLDGAAADQSLLLQTMSATAPRSISPRALHGFTFASSATAEFAWTSRLALQVSAGRSTQTWCGCSTSYEQGRRGQHQARQGYRREPGG